MKVLKLPEHDKLTKVSGDSQAIGQFIEWLRGSKKIIFCKLQDERIYRESIEEYQDEYYAPTTLNIQDILAEYFEIDLEKLEKEKRKILDNIRKANTTTQSNNKTV